MKSLKNPEHALLSASSAGQWLACPPSIRLCERLPDTESEYAKEGSLAHAICELKLRKQYLEPMSPKTFVTRYNKLKKDTLYKEEMEHYTEEYREYIESIMYATPEKPYICVEKRVDYSTYAPEGFGTTDCIILYGTTCHVIDFKYGKGVPVYAEGNPQMMLYALGVLEAYKMLYDIQTIKLSIVQPRLNNISEWETTADALVEWGLSYVKPKAALAFKGYGEFSAGDHCRFCKVKPNCRKIAEDISTIIDQVTDQTGNLRLPPCITDEEIGSYLTKMQSLNVLQWIKSLEDYSLKTVLSGGSISGWKVVEGRSNRVITDIDAAILELMNDGYPEAILCEKKYLSLTGLEKVISKESFKNVLSKYIDKPQGKPTLAPESDKRPEYQESSAQSDFGGSNIYKED